LGSPTPYPELNDVLRDLVAGVREILADNFCGAYLQGSFAVGDADEHSDVDFIVVTQDELTNAEVEDLQAMHERLFGLDSPWGQHLEGSYAPKNELRQLSRSPWWYLDNGSTELVKDSHCNTAVVRWSLRETGVVLAGPAPKTLIEPISADELRSDVLGTNSSFSRRGPGVIILSICRILHTFESGLVTTKREAGEWALGALSPEWASLVQQALDDRPDPWTKVGEPVEPAVVERTMAFVDYAVERTT
jgi:predicted nucleotidyltransferase